jgi:cation:H+ antiporter
VSLFDLPLLPLYLEFPLDFLTLVVAAELIVKSAESLSSRLGKGFTGGIVVGFMTAFPETLFVIIAMIAAKYDVAVGSALGGNIILFTFGIGMVGILTILKWKKPGVLSGDYKIEERYLLISNLALILLLIYGKLDIISGILIFLIYFIYVWERYKAYKEFVASHEVKKINLVKYISYLIIGSLIMVIFGHRFVFAIEELSFSIGIPAVIISLIISPIAAEFIEKLSSFRMVLRSYDNFTMALLSFIGSKIENMTILIGVIGILANKAIMIGDYLIEFLATIGVTFLALYVLIDRKLRLIEGLTLTVGYFAIIYLLLLL